MKIIAASEEHQEAIIDLSAVTFATSEGADEGVLISSLVRYLS